MQKIENVNYWRNPKFPGLETSLVKDSRHAFPNHAHDRTYALGLMLKGGSYCFGPGKKDSLVVPGQIALINPGQVHSGVPPQGVEITYRMIYVDRAVMQDAADEMCETGNTAPEFEKNIVEHHELFIALGRLCQLIPTGRGGLKRESIVFQTLVRLLSEFGDLKEISGIMGHERRVIRRAKEFLSADLDRKISLQEAARAAGLSRYHFLRVFKAETGLPPHGFRTQCRVETAKRLLRGKMPYAQVALETGFADQSHFTNTFRQYIGATPSQYLSGC